MTLKETQKRLGYLQSLRARIIEMASLQRELKGLILEQSHGLLKDHDTSNFSRDLGITWTVADRFLNKGRPAYDGKLLRSIAKRFELDELVNRIITLSKELPDRWKGLAASPDSVIHLVFDIQEVFTRQEDRSSLKTFASHFSPYHQVVEKAYWGSSWACGELEKPSIAAYVWCALKTNNRVETVTDKTASLIGTLGGETSPLGIKFVLSPASFKEIEGEISTDLIPFSKRLLELCRAVLNILSQLKADDVRRRVRETLGPEIEELELTIRLFTKEFPNRLTPLIHGQRINWAQSHTIGRKKS